MKTVAIHTLNPDETSAYHSYSGKIQVTIAETIGNTVNKIECDLEPKQAKQLFNSLRNSLIDAKVIRGKKKYS